MKTWIKLAGAVISGAGFGSIFSLAVDAILDDNSTGEKLDALIREPYESAGRLLADARVSRSNTYRFECLRSSREHFIKAQNLEKTLWVFHNGLVQSIEIERACRIVKASYYAGVCADLLSEPAISLRDYENAYATAMNIEGQLWTTRQHNGMSTFRHAPCMYSRRTVTAGLGLTFSWINSGWLGGTAKSISALPVTQKETREALAQLYEHMQPISDLLYKRGSHLRGLTPSRLLSVTNEPNSRQAAERFYADECKWTAQ